MFVSARTKVQELPSTVSSVFVEETWAACEVG
jgi:hypothetical protein